MFAFPQLDNVTSNLTLYRQKSESDATKFKEFMSKRSTERAQAATEIKALTDQMAQQTAQLETKTTEAAAAANQLHAKTAEFERVRLKLSVAEQKAVAGTALLAKIASRSNSTVLLLDAY